MSLLREMQLMLAKAAQAYSSVILADVPLGYWRLGEPTGTVAADSSGNAYNGTYVSCTQGAASLISNNGGNLAVSGNGTSSQITVGAIAALYNLSRSFSVEAWIKPSSVSGIFGIWSAGYLGFCVRRNNTSIELLLDYSISLGTVAASLAAGSKYHVVVTVDVSGMATIYINGTSIGTINASGYTYTGTYVRIGADGKDSSTVGTFLDGEIDEVAVYNSILSQTQITKHYQTGA